MTKLEEHKQAILDKKERLLKKVDDGTITLEDASKQFGDYASERLTMANEYYTSQYDTLNEKAKALLDKIKNHTGSVEDITLTTMSEVAVASGDLETLNKQFDDIMNVITDAVGSPDKNLPK